MGEHHHDHGNLKSRNLGIAIVLNVGITIAQVIGGFVSGSLALMSDAMHNFSDVLALIISWFANKLSKKDKTLSQTYGYKRAEILAALINAVSLFIIAFFLLKEAISRFFDPVQIETDLVMILGGLSIVLNGLSVLLVQKDAKENINMKSAYLHLFSDMISSVAVVFGGLVMYLWDVAWVDSLLSSGIAIYLVYASWGILKESVRILMQFAPANVDLEHINREIQKIPELINLHHIHIWQLDDKQINIEAHVSFKNDLPLSKVNQVLQQVEFVLNDKFKINHITLQPEINSSCGEDNLISQDQKLNV